MAFVLGTAVTGLTDPAGTTVASGATYTAAANALLYCTVMYDDNGAGTVVSSIVVSGSPTYSTAWAKLATNGRQFDSSLGGTELWWAVTSSGFTNQTITATISTSEKCCLVAQSLTGENTAAPIPTSNGSTNASSIVVTSSGNNGSLYVGAVGAGSNNALTVTAGSGYTIDGSVNFDNTNNKWVHLALETKNTVVSPAADTTVNFTEGGTWPGGCKHIIGMEVKAAGGAGAKQLAALGVG